MQLISFIERKTSKKIKAFCTNNGIEYISNVMQNMLAQHGIKPERSNQYNPPIPNGVAEHVNWITFDSAQTLIHAANLPKEYWLEAVQTIGYLTNGYLTFFNWRYTL